MVKRKSLWVLAIAGMLVMSRSPAVAQGSLDLTILDAETAPSSPLHVSAVVSGQKVLLARTGPDGSASIDFGMLNLSRGTPVGIHVASCNGTAEVILLPPGQVSDDCDRARRDPNCDCRKLGTVYWQETSAAIIDVSEGGELTITYTEMPAAQTSGGSSWEESLLEGTSRARFGFSLTLSSFTNLKSTACDQTGIGNCSVDDGGLGYSAYYEFGNLWPGRPFFVGLGGGFKSVDVTQSYPGFGSNIVDLDIWQIDAYGGWRFPFAERFEAFPMLGVSWMFNSASIATDFTTSANVTRSKNGLRMLFGGGLDWALTEQFGLRGTVRYLVGGSDDADTNWEFGAGMNYKL
ncbi:MAG: outer membrane protein [Gemmatimonadota bacterium]